MDGEAIVRRDLPHPNRGHVNSGVAARPGQEHGRLLTDQSGYFFLGGNNPPCVSESAKPCVKTSRTKTWWRHVAGLVCLLSLAAAHAGLTLTWLMAEPSSSLQDRWALVVELVFAGGGQIDRVGFSLLETMTTWTDDAPLLQGNHALNWYQVRLGISPWQNCAWDPSVYGGYLATPWWNASGRLATFWMLVEPSWRAYKLGLLLSVCLLPLLWWWAAWTLEAGSFGASISTLLCIVAFWNGPGISALNIGELDQIVASGLVPVTVGSWCLWQNQQRITAALVATVSLILLGWAYPLAGIVLFLVGVIWYLWLGPQRSGWWHLGTVCLGLLVAVGYSPMIRAAWESWWLMDGRFPEEHDSFWAAFSTLGLSHWFIIAAVLASALVGIWRCVQPSSRRIWLLALGACVLIGACPTLPCPKAWQPARCVGFTWPMLVILGVSGATRLGPAQTDPLDQIRQRYRRAARWLAWMLSAGLLMSLGCGVLVSDTLQQLWNRERPGLTPVQSRQTPGRVDRLDIEAQIHMLKDWLAKYTTLEAAIAVEEDDEFLNWSPSLIAASGRMFVNGLAREVPWAFYEFRLRRHDTADVRPASATSRPPDKPIQTYLNRRPINDWSKEELTELLDRWNVGWLLVRQPEVTNTLLRLPDTQLLAEDAKFGWRLLARKAPGYFLQGEGRIIRAQPGNLTLADLTPAHGRCVLRLTYLPGLTTSCYRCRVESVQLAEGRFPYWQVICPGPQARLSVRYPGPGNTMKDTTAD